MRGNLSFTTAERLLPAFLTALAKAGEADLALAIARGDVRDRHDWGMATLLTRTRRGQIWSDAASLASPLAPAELELGLRRLEQLVPMHGPGMQADLARSTEKVHELLRQSSSTAENLVHVVANLDRLTGALLERSFSQFARSHQPELPAPNCPFRGLYAFGLDDAALFYGREVLVTRLVSRLKEQRFLAILGESGCGKSSLALAGLASALRSDLPELAITTLRPSHDPLAQWQASVGQATAAQQLVIIDQFEELFTLCDDQSQRRTFIQRLLGLRQTHYVLVTMRADFWVDCAHHADLISVMQHAHELIAPMTAPELQWAMEHQAHEGKIIFEEGLSQIILDDVTDEPGAMPLLQHALQELWKRRYGRFLRLTDYLNIGGVQEAIAQTARSVYSGLPEEDRPLARQIFLQLTRVDTTLEADVRRDTRRRVALAQLCGDEAEGGPIRRLIERLADARLIVKRVNAAAGLDDVEVEIAHEALIRHWPDLRAWLNADREQLTFREMLRTSAREWEISGRMADLLVHRGTRLDQAERDLARQANAVSELERRYLAACRTQVKAEQPLKYLDRVGWALIVHPNEPVSVLQALWPLIDLRMRQMNFTQRDFAFEADETCGAWLARHTNEYQYTWLNHVGSIPPVLLYRHEEPFLDWLARHETGPGAPDLSRLPYYLLIVGKPGPTHADDQVYIPFTFQYLLDVQRAVGRLHFATLKAYAYYARSVVASESGHLSVPQRMAYFATRHVMDTGTRLSHEKLVLPLITALRNRHSDWNAETWLEAAATRSNLAQLFGSHQNPALLFTAGHGVELPHKDECFRDHLGALVTHDWTTIGRPEREHWFAGEDLATNARLLGGIAFFLANSSAGAAIYDNFHFDQERRRKQIAPHDMLAQLPQALLSHKQGGMLAVIGHVEGAWTFSFANDKKTSVIESFVQCLSRLMDGYPVGAALEPFNQRYAELAAVLSQQIETIGFRPSGAQATQPDPHKLQESWRRINDARNYIIIGDPAVRLPPTSPLADDQPRPSLAEIEALMAAESAA
jgi:energy-coupling factor transporter ATP-binding protein EcfA2